MPPFATTIKPLPSAFGVTESRFWDENNVTLAKPLVELEMVRLSAALRSKSSWWTQCYDWDILAKWRAEALEQAELMDESHIDYVLEELDGYANLRDEETGAEVACYDRIWQSDKLIPARLKAKLVAGVAKLENVPDSRKDWHPGSNGLVLDLVHPSLYPIIYGRTLVYPEGTTDYGAIKPQPIRPPKLPNKITGSWYRWDDYHISRKFQWLPTDFVVSDDGKSVKSVSYINNLNPHQHFDLHTTIEELIGAFIPLFERVLTDSILTNRAVPARTNNSYSYDVGGYEPCPDHHDYRDLSTEEFNWLYQQWADNRPIRLPDVSPVGYVTGSLETRNTWYSLARRTIQVIVKLTNIHLTPEKPEYAGGSWHVEGMSNEAIAASGIYYYSEENITESRLAFRTAACIPGYEQGDNRGCRLTWGIAGDDPCVNDLGAVVTCQDRAIAFPNIYQHKVSPFELKDKTKPGHRKIVALFLVDPAIHRPSTTTVPPQQHTWLTSTISADPTLKASFRKLAVETIDHIYSFVDGTMTRKEAEAYRLELMGERTAFEAENNEKFFQVPFDIWGQ
ncbi:hypothetical protein FRC08_013905 [Ceratobasidium sp. 394]|nr:hypothetical protein FRC08_013905 [Ceratobasidium sp. 394]